MADGLETVINPLTLHRSATFHSLNSTRRLPTLYFSIEIYAFFELFQFFWLLKKGKNENLLLLIKLETKKILFRRFQFLKI